MPLHQIISVPDGLLGIWQIAESVEELLSHFTAEEQKNTEYLRFNFKKRQTEWLCTRLLLKKMIGSNHRISYTESRKPILKHNTFKFISISHSREFVAILVHKTIAVGIDIESLSRNYAPVLKKYLSDQEQIQVGGNVLLQSLYWCAKEAVFKLVPEDGIDFRKQIQILPFDPQTTDRFPCRFISGEKQTAYNLQFKLIVDNCLVWVTGVQA